MTGKAGDKKEEQRSKPRRNRKAEGFMQQLEERIHSLMMSKSLCFLEVSERWEKVKTRD